MSDNGINKGSCLCEAVKIYAPSRSSSLSACHCTTCRKWASGPLMSVDCGTDVKFEGEEYIKVYNSSEWAERGFCIQCGSSLFYRLKQKLQYYIPIALFENCDDVVFKSQIFIDKKPKYYSFSNKTHTMTEAEVFAAFSPPPKTDG